MQAPDPTDLPVLADAVMPSPEATAALAARLSGLLGPGDVLLLSGDLGAGKTHFARALIQALQARHGAPEDVPSPSFTLVQTYEAGDVEIWHADLYRLSDPWEVDELGLTEAFDNAICLVEWPDRLGPDLPADALHVTLTMVPGAEDARRLVLSAARPGNWRDRLAGALPR